MNIINYAINNSKRVFVYAVVAAVIMLAFIPSIDIDTDPENMLAENETVRVMHDELKDRYNMHDIVVLGVINETHPEGVFNQASLTKVHELTEYIFELQETTEDADGSGGKMIKGVIKRDILAPSNVDHIEPVAPGTLKFDWLMSEAPKSEVEALAIRAKLLSNPLFKNTLVSEDGKAVCIYIPISSKDISHDISTKIQAKVDEYSGEDEFHITGLPVAEDTFGIEMFIQMAVTAPAAMLCIFFLMMFFFKKVKLILSPMIVALLSVICTMGLLIATGNTVHIMSSMIPIFVMPIAVLDSVHILSEFFDRYQAKRDRKETVVEVMNELYRPMLFTSLTSAAGFASLAITPIPPVQVFGIFVAFGILLAWLLTITLIPAYIMNMSDDSLQGFGMKDKADDTGMLSRFLNTLNRFTNSNSKLIILGSLAIFALSAYGISKIQINDNPIKWFSPDHPIRVADRALNDHFGGTYMAYLSLESAEDTIDTRALKQELSASVQAYMNSSNTADSIQSGFSSIIGSTSTDLNTEAYFEGITEELYNRIDESETDEEMEQWEEITGMVELTMLSKKQIFKNPEVLDYTLRLEQYLLENGGVGKVNSLAKLVKKINKELHEGSMDYHKLPDDFSSVGQCILSYQNSHTPERLRHFANTDYSSSNLWMQLKSGDNKDMEKTISTVDKFFAENPAPENLQYDWFGLTYINVIWQKKMVNGMLDAFLGSFLVVFVMMWLLFRSFKWALLCMLPLSLTIALIYGVIGFIGKDYDMPVAVLSSLALGLAIDFSIHFLVRSRENLQQHGTWAKASKFMFGEPSRAITRNVIVIAIGFLPLLFSSLVPYKTVGILLASILAFSGLITLILLPALIKLFEKRLV